MAQGADVSRLEEVRAAGATMKMHINYGDGYGYVYRCIGEPRISLSYGGPKGRKSKRKPWRVFLVEGVEEEFLTLEEAVAAVEALDQKAKDDVAWDAAAPPKKKPGYLPGMDQ